MNASADPAQKPCLRCGKPMLYIKSSNRKRCPPCVEAEGLERAKAWYWENKNKRRAYDAKRRKEKRELYRAASKRWREANREKKNVDTSVRRRRVRNQMPPWVSPTMMACFYEQSKRVSDCLGVQHHVDHTVPLKGRRVCGLHVPENLRVIPAPMNLKKSNHYERIG